MKPFTLIESYNHFMLLNVYGFIIIFNTEEYKVCPGVKVIATPGHTSDDVTVLAETITQGKSTCFAVTGFVKKYTNALSA